MNTEINQHNLNNETFQNAVQVIEQILDFNLWGFKRFDLQLFPQSSPQVVYKSKKCFVKFRWYQTRSYEEPMITVSYARLHALPNQSTMIWKGQKCNCWHIPNNLLIFLSESHPQEISISDYVTPVILQDFRKKAKYRKYKLGEFIAEEQLFIWEYYTDNFFNLLDLQYPELWERYSSFLKEYYVNRHNVAKLNGHNPINFDPPSYMVC